MLDDRWLLPMRRWRVRRSHPLAGNDSQVPVVSSVHQLVHSAAYRAVGAFLRSDLQDSWDEDDWRILTYVAEVGGTRGTAVFAVPLSRYEPDRIRVGMVEEIRQPEPAGRPDPGRETIAVRLPAGPAATVVPCAHCSG